MKRCRYCGRDNEETQPSCTGCGTSLAAPPPATPRSARTDVPWRPLAAFGLVVSLLFLVVLFPSAVLSGEFSRDLELTVPGLLFWLGIFFWSKRYLYPLRKHAPPAKSSTPPVAPAAPPTGQRTAADDDRT